MSAVIPNYCGPDPSVNSPTTASPNAVFSRTLGSAVELACLPLYQYVPGSGPLNVTCELSTQTTGVWTAATGYCSRALLPVVPMSPFKTNLCLALREQVFRSE